jgi:hypothetical protein
LYTVGVAMLSKSCYDRFFLAENFKIEHQHMSAVNIYTLDQEFMLSGIHSGFHLSNRCTYIDSQRLSAARWNPPWILQVIY